MPTKLEKYSTEPGEEMDRATWSRTIISHTFMGKARGKEEDEEEKEEANSLVIYYFGF